MAWLEQKVRRDGTKSWRVRDRRGKKQICIPGGPTRVEAEMKMEQYKIRRDLEKEGYGDKYEPIADDLFGRR